VFLANTYVPFTVLANAFAQNAYGPEDVNDTLIETETDSGSGLGGLLGPQLICSLQHGHTITAPAVVNRTK
jgi:hypothetical protein